MSRATLNLGILAHVDAGKTTLTERLLYAAGVIPQLGSVDAGTTQTDSLELERRRGITIRSAVVSFELAGVTVNLIDTPGHPDFIAEVERVLGVLDGAVLVLSAVEAVQPQTRILHRALRRLRIPTLLFVNKIDRAGAVEERVLAAIAERLTPDAVALGTVDEVGTRNARFRPFGPADAGFQARLGEVLAEHDDAILAEYVEDRALPYDRLHRELARATAQTHAHPVLFGSAITGAGIDPLAAAIVELLPAGGGDAGAPASGSVFKIDRGPAGDRVAYVRLFAGSVRVREVVPFGADLEDKITAIRVFERGAAVQRPVLCAGSIGQLWGLGKVQVGDAVGSAPARAPAHEFAPPTLESVVVPVDVADRARLRLALGQLAEQDPLIDVRQDETGVLAVSLYGDVQKEVLEATLREQHGIDVVFRETTPLYVERLRGPAEAVEVLNTESNPFLATIALRLDPAPDGSGVSFRLDVDPRTVPLYLYKTLASFHDHMEGYARLALRDGLLGWEVTDCRVSVTRCVYSVPDGPPSRRGPLSTAADFRKLTPLVLLQALERAGTVVCEPSVRVSLELPAASLRAVLGALARLGGRVEAPARRGDLVTIDTVMPVLKAQELHRRLPGLTGGEGVMESRFAGYQPAVAEQPARRRLTPAERAAALRRA